MKILLTNLTGRKGLLATLTCALSVFASADFKQADLEAIVKSLDPYLTHNSAYKYPVICQVVDKDDVNAYATVEPTDKKELQTKMVVYTGLVKLAKGDTRLIRAVVAHEMAHLSKGHIGQGMKPSDLDVLLTRQQEFEADITGASALQAAGFSKKDMVDMLLLLRTVEDGVPWLRRQTGDHASCATRAAEISGNPNVMRSLVDFETGVAYMQCRSYTAAMNAFDRAISKEPKLHDAYTDAAQAALMRYYDFLPQGVKETWLKPDFGPVLTPPLASKGAQILDEDRKRYADASARILRAIEDQPEDRRTQELASLLMVLHPDAKPESVKLGIDGFEKLLKGAMDPKEKLRLANNLAVGMQRANRLEDGLSQLLKAQASTESYNEFVALNVGLKAQPTFDADGNNLALRVIGTWLLNGSRTYSEYDAMYNSYLAFCKKLALEPKKFDDKPVTICQVVSMTDGDKELSILEPIDSVLEKLGKPEGGSRYDDNFKDMLELFWQGGSLRLLTERESVLRVTSYSKGAYIMLRPRKESSQETFKITVGMTKDEFNQILDLKNGAELSFVRGGDLETWVYFRGLGMGVCVKDDKIVGITATPARV